MHKSPNHPTAYRFKPCLTEHSFHASTTHSTSTSTSTNTTPTRIRTRTTSTSPSTNTTILIHFPITDAEYRRFFEDAADAMSKSENPKQPKQYEKRTMNTNNTNPASRSTTTNTGISLNSTTPPKPKPKRVATWIHIPQETTTTTPTPTGTPTPGKILGHCPVPACGYTTTSRSAYEDHITGTHSLKVVRVSDFFPCPHPKCSKRSHADAVYTARGGGGDGAGQQVPVCTHEMIVHVDYPASHRSYYSAPRF